MTLNEVYHLLEKRGICIVDFIGEQTPSLSVEGYIGIDIGKLSTMAEEKTCLMHEGGHCMTGSFYNIMSSLDIRGKHELAADKWAVKKLIPKNELEAAFIKGYTEPWQLAEHFEVTQAMIQRAYYIYYQLESK